MTEKRPILIWDECGLIGEKTNWVEKVLGLQVKKHKYPDGREYTYIEKTNEMLPANYLACKFEYERAGTDGAIFKLTEASL